MKLIYSALIGLSIATTIVSCSGQEKKDQDPKAPEVPTVDPQGLKMAFYNSDSLNSGFDYLKKQDSLIKIKQERFQKEYQTRENSLRQFYQRMVNAQEKMLVSSDELKKMGEQYQRQEQSLMNYQQTEGGKLQEEAAEMQTVLNNRVSEFAKRYCEKYKLDILMMHAPGGQFTYYNPKMDVTESFIEFVNAEQKKMDKDLGQ
jgi:Skp family chaperone for outer membrane proteins